MSVTMHDMIKLAKHFNKSHHYHGKEQVAPHHHKEAMKLVEAKARTEMVQHRMKRKAIKEEAANEED